MGSNPAVPTNLERDWASSERALAYPDVTSLPTLPVRRRHERLLVAVVVLLALLIRLQFVQQAVVQMPMSGDSRHYVAYAINLEQHHTFSKAVPGEPVVADSYRSPGYPLFLAACMRATGGVGDNAWYRLALFLQCLLGAATAWITILLARQWMPPAAALAAGLGVAIWPHHVVASSALLIEVLLGFVLAAALLLAARAHSRRSLSIAAGAGATLAFATLVNPAMLLLPVFISLPFLFGSRKRLLYPLLLLPLLGFAGWAWRDAHVSMPGSPGRGALNFVQGSWPGMHDAWRNRLVDANAAFTMAQIDAEAAMLEQVPSSGLTVIGRRMAASPGRYARWYLVEKPFLLWDWDVRVGSGDIYVNAIESSPFEKNPVLRAISRALHAVNPMLFALALAGALVTAWRARQGVDEAAPLLVTLAFAYFTLVHDVFQAEPRYAIAYRAEEMLLVAAALVALASLRRARSAGQWNPNRA